jgi:hypothetical protein
MDGLLPSVSSDGAERERSKEQAVEGATSNE